MLGVPDAVSSTSTNQDHHLTVVANSDTIPDKEARAIHKGNALVLFDLFMKFAGQVFPPSYHGQKTDPSSIPGCPCTKIP